MKAFRNFVILLGLALFLVPFKNVYALDQNGYPEPNMFHQNFNQRNLPYTMWYYATSSGQQYKYVISSSNPLKLTTYTDGTFMAKQYDNADHTKVSTTGGEIENYIYIEGSGYWLNEYSNYRSPEDSILIGKINSIISANYVLYDETGILSDYHPLPTFEIIDMKILTPSSGYKDTVDGVSGKFYYKVTPNTSASNLNVKIYSDTIPSGNFKMVNNSYTSSSGEGFIQVDISPLSIGQHTITFEINGQTVSRTFERLNGVVDENNDGIDDRTNLPIGDGHIPDVPNTDYINSSIGTLKSLMTEFQGFQTFITSFLGVFPTWITLPISALFSVLVIMTIVKIIRG